VPFIHINDKSVTLKKHIHKLKCNVVSIKVLALNSFHYKVVDIVSKILCEIAI